MDKRMSLTDRLALLLEEKEITETEMARRMCVSQSTMSRIVRGEFSPRYHTLIKMAKVLDVTVGYLVGDEEDRTTLPTTTMYDNSMHGSFDEVIPKGFLLTYDPLVTPVEGSVVIVKTPLGRLVCRALVLDLKGNYLRPYNTQYPMVRMPSTWVMVGAVTTISKELT